ncbi:Transcription factor [Arachis hypogaea]|nr:Transcription factor [Arachis hypogaea]
MDKAALLGSVVDHVKDLKLKAMDVSKNITIPSETHEVTIECDPDHQDESYAKVKILKHNIVISVCCDDRPELFSELIQVLKGLRLTAIKADIAVLVAESRAYWCYALRKMKEVVVFALTFSNNHSNLLLTTLLHHL